MSVARLLLLLSACIPALSAARAAEVVPARRVDVADQALGLTIPDPYRWMEGEGNPEFDAWLQAHGKQTRSKLSALPSLGFWRQRLTTTATAVTEHRVHKRVGNRLFFLREVSGRKAELVVTVEGGGGHTIFDPNTDLGTSITNFSPSTDGAKVTINIAHSGKEAGEVALYDVDSRKRLGDTLKPVWSEFSPSWLPDDSGFFYTRMRETAGNDPLQGMGAYIHILGQPQSMDRRVASAGESSYLNIAAHDFPIIDAVPGSDWAMLSIIGARASGRSCFGRLRETVANSGAWRCLVSDTDQIQAAHVHGNTAYLLQAKDVPNRRVLALDLADPKASLAKARVVVPERKDIVLTDFSLARDGLYLKSMRSGVDRIERLAYGGGELAPVVLPYEGTVRLMTTDPLLDGALLTLESWTKPRRVYQFDPHKTELRDTGFGTITDLEYPQLVSEKMQTVSADGTRVPMSVVRPVNLPRDGSARALVDGYGAYGISKQPLFSPVFLEWANAGNVLAICHVRGGGENGDSWRQGGQGSNKQRGVEDYIACAHELSKRGYSAPARTAGFARSMGGILAGGAYTTEPEAYGAMVVEAGILNATRLLEAKNGANQIVELGDPRNAEGLRQLLALDPYQRVQDGRVYPPLLLVVGLTDQRVAPWNSGKFGARVQHASPGTELWFRIDEESGHFASSAGAQAQKYADIFAFLDAQLGADKQLH